MKAHPFRPERPSAREHDSLIMYEYRVRRVACHSGVLCARISRRSRRCAAAGRPIRGRRRGCCGLAGGKSGRRLRPHRRGRLGKARTGRRGARLRALSLLRRACRAIALESVGAGGCGGCGCAAALDAGGKVRPRRRPEVHVGIYPAQCRGLRSRFRAQQRPSGVGRCRRMSRSNPRDKSSAPCAGAAAGEAVAVLLDQTQAAALPSLPFAAELKTLWQSAELPCRPHHRG